MMPGRKRLTNDLRRKLGDLVEFEPALVRQAMKDKGLTQATLLNAFRSWSELPLSKGGLHYLTANVTKDPTKRAQGRARLGVLNVLATVLGKPVGLFTGQIKEDRVVLKFPRHRPITVQVRTDRDGSTTLNVPLNHTKPGMELFVAAFLSLGLWRRLLLTGDPNPRAVVGEGRAFFDHMVDALKMVLRPIEDGRERANLKGLFTLTSILMNAPRGRRTIKGPRVRA